MKAQRGRVGIIKRWVWLGVMLVLGVPGMANAIDTNRLPQLQALYGGTIRGLNVTEPNGTTNQVRIFLRTDFSANSVFYADINHSSADPFSTNNFRWQVVPDFNAQASFGTVNEIAVHQASGRLFMADDDGLFSCTTSAGSLVTNISASDGTQFLTLGIHDSVLLAIAARHGSNILCFGTLDSAGTFTQGAGSPIGVGLSAFSSTAIQMAVNPTNHYVYIIDSYGTNGIKKSSAPCDALSGATTFSTISISSVISNWGLGRQVSFGPDGRMFIGSKVGSTNTIAYSDNDGTNWTTVDTGVIGKGYNFDTAGSATQYSVAFGKAISTNKGEAGSWGMLGTGGPVDQTRANDSSIKFDPINSRFIYFASDQGVGCTTNGGPNLSSIDFGLEAVSIQDLDMTEDKTLGWTASASGLRRGAGAAGALQWTPHGTFPMNDGAPYYSIAMDKADVSGNTLYAGNNVIYRTLDGGTNWSKVYEPAMGGELFVSSIKAISNTVFAGFYVRSSPYNGGLVYSANGGTLWANIPLESGTNGVNVNKILLTQESGNWIAYIGAAYNTNNNTGGHIYRVTASGATHISLSPNPISIRDLARDSSDGIYASGWTENYDPVVYYKVADSSDWTLLTTNGLSYTTGYPTGRGLVITVGRDASSNEVPIVGVGVDLYYLSSGASAWTTSSELHYPNGAQLNVLYWDALMVGTDCGLFGQDILQPGASENTIVTGDFDGDGKTDPGLYRSDTGNWYVKLSAGGYGLVTINFGGSGYSACVGDYDGDGKADPAVYQKSTGNWYVQLSSMGYAIASMEGFGGSAYAPVAADYDGDGKADPAIYENATGNWQVKLSASGYATATLTGFGGSGMAMKVADFDGDGKTDPAVYEEATGNWTVKLSGSGYATASLPGFGGMGYEPAAADYDGDGLTDPAIYQGSTGEWSVKISGSNYATATLTGFGGTGYSASAADFDGDGKADPILLDEATGVWHVKLSANSYAEVTTSSGYTP